jgi:hypothetical protein
MYIYNTIVKSNSQVFLGLPLPPFSKIDIVPEPFLVKLEARPSMSFFFFFEIQVIPFQIH